MKKFLLFAGLAFSATLSTAQVIFYVDPPSTNEGNYDFTWADPGGGDWACPDLNNSANSVQDTLVFATDATTADSLVCDDSVNPNVDGQIAVIYRGSCEFGLKALHCQNAGAVAVVIINNIAGAPIEMGGGAEGLNVTIPVVMISDIDGALLADDIATETFTAFIGSKTGFYGDDLGFYPEDVLRAEHFSNLQALSQDASEFEVQLGGWVRNYGSNTQTNVTLNATIDNGSVIYDETSTPEPSILPGDSIYVTLPTFSQSSYANGYYNVTYTIESDATDEFIDDNTQEADFMISDSLFAYSRLDETTQQPTNVAFYRGGNSTASNSGCLAFRDENASRMAINGMTFSAATSQNPDPTSIDGEFIQVFAYAWYDNFVDLNDANAGVTNIVQIADGEYIYEADLQQENIFVPFDAPVLLEDNQRYLFCVAHYGTTMFSGYDTGLDYDENTNLYLQPQFPGESDGTWFLAGFGTDVVPALSVNMFTAAAGLENIQATDITAYPNPANAEVNIQLGENYGDVELSIMDMSGRVVSTQSIEMNSSILTVDVTTLASGSYVFNVKHGDKNEVLTVSVNR